MSNHNQVVWTEGLFIKPQHFQQQQRHIDYLLDQRINSIGAYFYGLTSLRIDTEKLKFGQVGVLEISGIMKDGTVFSVPAEDLLPQPLDINKLSVKTGQIMLAVPVKNYTSTQVIPPDVHKKTDACLRSQHIDVRDLHSEGGDTTILRTGCANLMLLHENDCNSNYIYFPIVCVSEGGNGIPVKLSQEFMPCCINIKMLTELYAKVTDFTRTVEGRIEHLSEQLAAPGQRGVADVAEFLLLQLCNRMYQQLHHLTSLEVLHPERLFEALVQFYGELQTFFSSKRVAQKKFIYLHEDPGACFNEMLVQLNRAMSHVLTPRAEHIALIPQSYGVRVAVINDAELLQHGQFVLAVSARMPPEQLNKQFIQQVKIASSEKIRDLINIQLRGVPLTVMPSAPRQIPYHANCSYFELARNSAEWVSLITGNSLAVHISGDFPELEMALWIIRDY